jgi:hypothetical protein
MPNNMKSQINHFYYVDHKLHVTNLLKFSFGDRIIILDVTESIDNPILQITTMPYINTPGETFRIELPTKPIGYFANYFLEDVNGGVQNMFPNYEQLYRFITPIIIGK